MRRKETVSTETKVSDHMQDALSRLQDKRVLFLTDEINSEKASTLAAQIVLLSHENPKKDIYLFINSEGGAITDTMAIYDVMNGVPCDVATVCIGEAASGAAILLSAGAKGKRYALPNARIMLHQPQGGIEGSTKDVEIEAKELVRLREQLYAVLEKATRQKRPKLRAAMDRDTYMSAKDAEDFGLIDEVIDRIPGF